MLEFVIRQGLTDIDARSTYNSTALPITIHRMNYGACEMLLQCGAAPNLKTEVRQPRAPLELMNFITGPLCADLVSIVLLLLENGAVLTEEKAQDEDSYHEGTTVHISSCIVTCDTWQKWRCWFVPRRYNASIYLFSV